MIYLFLAEGFEEVEALAPLDLLRRAGETVTTVGVGGREIKGSHGISVKADISDFDYCDEAPDMLIFPGGMPGTLNLDGSAAVDAAIKKAVKAGAYLAAICAAPMILGRRGLLQGKNATCYPGFEGELKGAVPTDAAVVKDGRIITGKGMGVAVEFGLVLVETLKGTEAAERLRHAVIAD